MQVYASEKHTSVAGLRSTPLIVLSVFVILLEWAATQHGIGDTRGLQTSEIIWFK